MNDGFVTPPGADADICHNRVAATDYEQVRRTLGLLLSALRSGEGVSRAVEEEFAKGLGALKRLAGKVGA